MGTWARADAESAAANLNVRNVGNITSGNLDNFVTTEAMHTPAPRQADYSTCYAFVAATVTGKPTGSAGAAFFTSYLGSYSSDSNYVSRQELRPVDSPQVYQRFKNGNANWGAWIPSVPQSIGTTYVQLYENRFMIRKGTVTNFINRQVRITGYVINDTITTPNTSGTVTLTNGMSGSWSSTPRDTVFDITGTLGTSSGGPNEYWLWVSQTLNITGTTMSGYATITAW